MKAGGLEARADEIRTMYLERGMTQAEIATAIGASQRAVQLFMRRHAVPQRKQAKRDQRGDKNSTWRGSAISYKGAHDRVAAVRGRPKRCEDCARSIAWDMAEAAIDEEEKR